MRAFVVSLAALLALSVAPRIASAGWDDVPDWSFKSSQSPSDFGYYVSTAGDVNGDGYSDLLVGDPIYTQTFVDRGKAYLFLGGPSGPAAAPSWTHLGDLTNSLFGVVAYAGDINGDGYDDVAIGEPGYNGNAGRVQIFRGSASGLAATADQVFLGSQPGQYLGWNVVGLGDVNGDGFADLAIASPAYSHAQTSMGLVQVHLGGPSGLAASPVWSREGTSANDDFGYMLSAVGDVNGDGYDELLVGELNGPGGQRVNLYLGESYGLTTSVVWNVVGTGGATGQLTVGLVGDVDGDGYSDILIGEPLYNTATTTGRVRLFNGGAPFPSTTASWTAYGPLGSHFADSLGPAGDINGDGLADLFVSADYETDDQTHEGTVYVWVGSKNGPTVTTPYWRIEADRSNASFGLCAAGAGDVNGDGFGDFLVGAPDYKLNASSDGAAFLFLGGGDHYSFSPDWTKEINVSNAEFGSASAMGDWNGDGHSDLAVAAPGAPGSPGGLGQVQIFYGADAGLPAAAQLTLTEDGTSNSFGASLANAGDVNGDGYEDLLVGSPGWSANSGKVYLYEGGLFGLGSQPDWSTTYLQTGTQFGSVLAGAGDVNGDGFGDFLIGNPLYAPHNIAEAGAAFLFFGAVGGPGASPNASRYGTQANEHFGASLGTTGDSNGDGFSDVIIGSPGASDGQAGEGLARIYLGSGTGLGSVPFWTEEGNQIGAAFGSAVSTAGDVNGDGVSDVVVGAPGYDNGQTNEGRAFVYNGLDTSPIWSAESNEASAQFGSEVAPAGDVNGDGYADFLVGSPLNQFLPTNQGIVRLYFGQAGGAVQAMLCYPNLLATGFGRSLATGDVNGDGFSDALIGAPTYGNGQTGEGRAYFYYGNGTDGASRERRQTPYNPSFNPIALHGQAPDEDRVRLTLTGRSPMGRARVRLQYDIERFGQPFNAPALAGQRVDTGPVSVSSGSEATLSVQLLNLVPSGKYIWRVRTVTDSPLFPRSPWLSVIGNSQDELDFRAAPAASAVGEAPPSDALLQLRAAPNPFSGALSVHYRVDQPGPVDISVFDIQGRRVTTLVHETGLSGERTLAWDGRGADGSRVAPGVYLIEIRAPGGAASRKVVKAE